jgi:hypothetical protein
MKFSCFDLEKYTTDAEIHLIAREVEAPSSEDAAEAFARVRDWNSAGDQDFPMNVVVMGEGNRDVWEVERQIIAEYKTSLQESISEGSDEADF